MTTSRYFLLLAVFNWALALGGIFGGGKDAYVAAAALMSAIFMSTSAILKEIKK